MKIEYELFRAFTPFFIPLTPPQYPKLQILTLALYRSPLLTDVLLIILFSIDLSIIQLLVKKSIKSVLKVILKFLILAFQIDIAREWRTVRRRLCHHDLDLWHSSRYSGRSGWSSACVSCIRYWCYVTTIHRICGHKDNTVVMDTKDFGFPFNREILVDLHTLRFFL